MILLFLVVVCSIVIRSPKGQEDMFTAIAELGKIFHVEQELAEDLRDYIGKEEERLRVKQRTIPFALIGSQSGPRSGHSERNLGTN